MKRVNLMDRFELYGADKENGSSVKVGYVVAQDDKTVTIQMGIITRGVWSEKLAADDFTYDNATTDFFLLISKLGGCRIHYPKKSDMYNVYRFAALEIATNGHSSVWLGSPNATNSAYCVSSDGGGCNNRNYLFAVAPAFTISKNLLSRSKSTGALVISKQAEQVKTDFTWSYIESSFEQWLDDMEREYNEKTNYGDF